MRPCLANWSVFPKLQFLGNESFLADVYNLLWVLILIIKEHNFCDLVDATAMNYEWKSCT